MKRGAAVSIVVVAAMSLARSQALEAQSTAGYRFEVGAQVTSARVGELDANDVGFGGRLSWFPSSHIGVEGELNFFPRDIPERSAVTGSRFEGLFGLTAGPRLNGWRPFARARAGFLTVGASPQPKACILIFPPPVSCGLAAGETLFAADIGGGIEVYAPRQTFLRVDVGDRMLRYPGPSLDRSGTAHDGAFIGHDVRVALGGGWRF